MENKMKINGQENNFVIGMKIIRKYFPVNIRPTIRSMKEGIAVHRQHKSLEVEDVIALISLGWRQLGYERKHFKRGSYDPEGIWIFIT